MRVKRNLGDANSLGVSKSPEDGGEEGQVVTEPPATAVVRYVCLSRNDLRTYHNAHEVFMRNKNNKARIFSMLNATLNTKTAGNHTLDSRFCAPQHDCGQGGAGASAAAAMANISLEVALSMYFGEATVDLGFAFAEAAGAAAPMLVQCPLQASTGITCKSTYLGHSLS